MFETEKDIAYAVDQTLLKPEATQVDYEGFIQRNAGLGFHTIFVPPSYLELMVKLLSRTKTLAGAIVGFPFGWETRREKIYQINQALTSGADEVDFVMNISKLKSGDGAYIRDELKGLRDESLKFRNKFGEKITLKCIIECCLLTDDEKRRAVELIAGERVDYVKTSTGFNKWGAKVEDVKLLAEASGGRIKIKASGGIRTFDDFLALTDAGASRIGTSAGEQILAGWKNRL